MTKILETAIAKARALSAEDQDIALDDETREAIREGLAQARRGEIVSDEEIETLWLALESSDCEPRASFS